MKNLSKILLVLLAGFIAFNGYKLYIVYNELNSFLAKEQVTELIKIYAAAIIFDVIALFVLCFAHLKGYFKLSVITCIVVFTVTLLYLFVALKK